MYYVLDIILTTNMDILGSSLTSPSVPMDRVARFQLAKKRGPGASDREDVSQREPLMFHEDVRKRTTLLDRVKEVLHIQQPAHDQDLLVTTPQQPNVLQRMLKAAGRFARRLCEGLVNGFLGAADAKPY